MLNVKMLTREITTGHIKFIGLVFPAPGMLTFDNTSREM